MKNLLDLILWQFGWLFSPVACIITTLVVIGLILWRVAYKAKTNELSVTYAKIVLQRYKDSRAKTPPTFYDYLDQELANVYPTKIKHRILKSWFKELSKGENTAINYYNYGLYGPKVTYKKIVADRLLWFKSTDKNSRIYHLKKVISRNNK